MLFSFSEVSAVIEWSSFVPSAVNRKYCIMSTWGNSVMLSCFDDILLPQLWQHLLITSFCKYLFRTSVKLLIGIFVTESTTGKGRMLDISSFACVCNFSMHWYVLLNWILNMAMKRSLRSPLSWVSMVWYRAMIHSHASCWILTFSKLVTISTWAATVLRRSPRSV